MDHPRRRPGNYVPPELPAGVTGASEDPTPTPYSQLAECEKTEDCDDGKQENCVAQLLEIHLLAKIRLPRLIKKWQTAKKTEDCNDGQHVFKNCVDDCPPRHHSTSRW